MTTNELSPTVRVVITGHDADGRGVVVSDRQVPPHEAHAAGHQFHLLWGTDELPVYPDDGSRTTFTNIFPGVGAIRLAHLIVHPDSSRSDSVTDGRRDDADARADRIEGVNTSASRPQGMHYTPSIDLQTVISGEVDVVLDDGLEVHLRPGDSLIQQGAWHAWRNRGSEPAHVIAAVIGVRHQGFPDA